MMILNRTTISLFIGWLLVGRQTEKRLEVDKESTDKSREKRWSLRIGVISVGEVKEY